MTACLFCKIIAGEIPAKIIYQDDDVIAMDDINPHAPVHKLIVPRQHISTINDAQAKDEVLLGHMIMTAKKIAIELGIEEDGYRVAMNCNKGAGQTVFHIHLHLLGGRAMTWPPG